MPSTCPITPTRIRKLVGVGMIVQIVLFSTYLTVFQAEYDPNGTRTLAHPPQLSQMVHRPVHGNPTGRVPICNPGEGACPGGLQDVTNVSSACSGIVFPGQLMKLDTWQAIEAGRNGYVFSAYYDRGSVKILGATTTKLGPVTCQLWYSTDETSAMEMVETAATVTLIPEGHGKRFTAAFLTCHVPENKKDRAPYAVSVVKNKCSTPLNVVPITMTTDKPAKNKFTICVSPFNFHYGRAYELIEWIELNRILGADKFVFYNYSVASNVESVLQAYIKQEVVEVVAWQLPMGVAKWPPVSGSEEIHYFGQLASLNECLLRNRGRSEFVVNLDLDEFVIPRKKDVKTWQEMLASQPDASAYVFANVFFRKEWNTSSTNYSRYELAKRYKLVTLLQLQHENVVNPYKTRSKYFAKPFSVEVLGIHNIWRIGGKQVNVPHDVALLHHYRNWLKYAEKQTRIDDDTVLQKFKDELLDNVASRWDSFPGVELDIPLCDHPKDYGAC